MSYEFAPATTLLATHCAVCRRPLLDSMSVEIGMGPVCRERHGYNTEMDDLPGCRDAANCIVHRIAACPDDEQLRADGCAALRVMGFKKLPDRIEYRGKDAPAKAEITVRAYTLPAKLLGRRWLPARTGFLVHAPFKPSAIPAWRAIRGRVFLKHEGNGNFVPGNEVEALRKLLRDHHAGETCVGPNGRTVIGGTAAPTPSPIVDDAASWRSTWAS